MNEILKLRTALLTAVALATMSACATSPDRPYQQLAGAEAGIEQAEQSNAREFGASELDAARDKLAKARAAADSNDNLAAARYAEEAALDANLATAITRNRKAELSVEELNKSIETLQQEIARNQRRSGISQ
ncbi:MAG: DUF4398 domain-containing protein [Woeseia sp.]